MKIWNNLRKLFTIVLKDKNRKPVVTILTDILRLWYQHRSFPMHYFGRYLYHGDAVNVNMYVSNKILYSLWPRYNKPELIPVLDNKLLFYIYFHQKNIRVIDIIAHNSGHVFMAGKEKQSISNTDQFREFLLQLTENSAEKSIYIKKAFGSSGGGSIYKITQKDFPRSGIFINELFQNIVQSSYIFQETLVQHPAINKINPSCINSLRIDTFVDKEGNAEVISSFLRYGICGSIVDNTSSGGCQVTINLQTGKLEKYGYATISDGQGKVFAVHPDTGIQLEGYTVPFYFESLELVLRAARAIPGIRMVGWDVAIAPDGPVLIEGNHDYDMTGTDLALGGCKKSPVFMKIIEEAGLKV